MRGWSELDVEGQPFHAPEAITAFVGTLKARLRPEIPVVEVDTDINDPQFAALTAQALLTMIQH